MEALVFDEIATPDERVDGGHTDAEFARHVDDADCAALQLGLVLKVLADDRCVLQAEVAVALSRPAMELQFGVTTDEVADGVVGQS